MSGLKPSEAVAWARGEHAQQAREPATLPGPGLVMCPACCAQFDPALNLVKPVQDPAAWRWRIKAPADNPDYVPPWTVTTYYPMGLSDGDEVEPLYAATK